MVTIANLDTALSGGLYRRSMASFLRPGNATTYATGDVVGTAVAAALEFPKCSKHDGHDGIITDALLVLGDNATATADFELLVFNAEPTGIVDNAALLLLDADLPMFVATLTFATQIITGASQVAYQAVVDSEKAFTTAAVGGSLYGLLVNRTAAWATPLTACPIMVSLGITTD